MIITQTSQIKTMLTFHAHSYYSLLQSTISIDELIDFAKTNGSSYVALTDTNAMNGLIQLAKKSKENNIKPILGVYIDDANDKNIHALFLARNNEGYAELCKIITSRKLKDNFSVAALCNQKLPNLYIVTSSIELLRRSNIVRSNQENLFVELVSTTKRKKISRELYQYASENNLKIVATHPAYFAKKEDHLLHKAVTAIRLNTTLANMNDDDIIDEEYYLITPQEFQSKWRTMPEALLNTELIAKDCNVDLSIGKYKFPIYSLPPGETSYSRLSNAAFGGLAEKYQPVTADAVKRLQYELEVINDLGYSDYFLVVHDVVKEAKKRGMMLIGRGSAANSLVAYCLGFTQVDPIRYNLYFERFLNRGRKSPPDVDLDFSWRERDEIVKYVYDRYGYEHVAMISTTVTFRARSAFREVAKVFGVSNQEVSKYSKFIPWTSAYNLPHLAEKFPEAKSLHFQSEPWKSIIKVASQLSSFPRHLSIHASGIVVTPEPMTNYVALEYAKNKGLGLIITQPDMYSIEEMGLVKIDLLSQRSLGVFRDTMKRIQQQKISPKTSPQVFSITPTAL